MSQYDAYKSLLDALRLLPPSAAKECAIEKLEESAFWASAAIVGTTSPIEYVVKDDVPRKPSS